MLKDVSRQIISSSRHAGPNVPGLRSLSFLSIVIEYVPTVLFLALLLSSCSGSGNVNAPDEGTRETDKPTILADYETLDASKYADPPPAISASIEHDVPRLLMESRADSGIVRIVDGYRIQIFQTLDRDKAVATEERVRSWWQSHAPDPDSLVIVDSVAVPAFPTVLTVYNLYRQPYYRVRVGDFVDRDAAERLHSVIIRPFPGSLVVPDRVTIERQ